MSSTIQKKNPWLAILPFWLFVFLFKFSAGLHYTLLPVLGEKVLPIWAVGIIISAASLLQLVFDVPVGFLMDRFGYVRVMRVSAFFFFLGACVLLFHFSLFTYLLTIFLGFVGWVSFLPGANAYTLAEAPREEGGRYMGIQHTFASLGIVCSSILLIFIVRSPIIIIGITLSFLFLLALLALMNTRKDRVSLAELQTRHAHHAYYLHRHFIHKVFKSMKHLDPPSIVLALQNLTGAIFYAVIWFAIPLVIAAQSNSGILAIGLSIFDLAVVILGAILGKLADRYQKKMLIFLGLLLFSVMGIFLGFNLNIFFLLLGFLATTGDEMSSVSLWSWLERLDTDHQDDGLVNGAIVFFEDIGWTIGPVAAGFLFASVGPSLTIAIGALPILLAWLFAIFFLRGKKEPEPMFTEGYSLKPIRNRHKK